MSTFRPCLLLALPLFALACSSGSGSSSDSENGGTSANGSSAEGGQATANQGEAGASQGGTGAASVCNSGATGSCAAPIDIGVRIVGRHDGCATDGVRIHWSGTGFVGIFDGTGAAIRLREAAQGNQYTVIVDGTVGDLLVTSAGEASYTVAQDLASGTHELELYRRTEASFGIATILGVDVTGGALKTPPAAPERNIEIVGDSITCGYGDEGTSSSCTFSADTENNYLAYGSLLGQQFGAEVSTVAWSGKGVVWNYGGNTLDPMPNLYTHAIVGDKRSIWDFSVKPQAVIINLGTNDYSSASTPADNDFIEAYEGLLANIRCNYPDAFILCTIGPMLSGSKLTVARANIATAVEARNTAGDSQVEAYEMQSANSNPGCDWHPSLATHQAMADELAAVLSDRLGW